MRTRVCQLKSTNNLSCSFTTTYPRFPRFVQWLRGSGWQYTRAESSLPVPIIILHTPVYLVYPYLCKKINPTLRALEQRDQTSNRSHHWGNLLGARLRRILVL